MERIYIILPVHNRKKITQTFVQNLKAQTYRNFQLILVDDGSTDGTSEMVLSELPESVILRGDGNLWWAGSLQKAYRWLRAQKNVMPEDVVLIINDDVTFSPDFLRKGAGELATQPKTFLLAQCLAEGSNDIIDIGVAFNWVELGVQLASTPEAVNCLSTRGLFARAEDFLSNKGFYPRLLPHYLSDYEFTMRAKRRGIKLAVSPNVKIWTTEAASGENFARGTTLREKIKSLFSKRYYSNPLYLTTFVMLACPSWRGKINNLIKIWKEFCKQIFPFFPAPIRFSVQVARICHRNLRATYLDVLKAPHYFWYGVAAIQALFWKVFDIKHPRLFMYGKIHLISRPDRVLAEVRDGFLHPIFLRLKSGNRMTVYDFTSGNGIWREGVCAQQDVSVTIEAFNTVSLLRDALAKAAKVDLVVLDMTGEEIHGFYEGKDFFERVNGFFIYFQTNGTAQTLGYLLGCLTDCGFAFYVEQLHAWIPRYRVFAVRPSHPVDNMGFSVLSLTDREMARRKAILAEDGRRALVAAVEQAKEIRLVVGASGVHDPGWIPTEKETLSLTNELDWERVFSKKQISAILSEHVFEHLSKEDAEQAAQNCFRFLKPGGYLRAAVPDGFHSEKEYIENVKPGGIGPGAKDHKVLYTYKSFKALFERVGFRVRLLEYFDEEGVFHSEEWSPEKGLIQRSKHFDPRNADGKLHYSSIIIDALKPLGSG